MLKLCGLRVYFQNHNSLLQTIALPLCCCFCLVCCFFFVVSVWCRDVINSILNVVHICCVYTHSTRFRKFNWRTLIKNTSQKYKNESDRRILQNRSVICRENIMQDRGRNRGRSRGRSRSCRIVATAHDCIVFALLAWSKQIRRIFFYFQKQKQPTEHNNKSPSDKRI